MDPNQDTAEGMSFSGLEIWGPVVEYMPLDPMKYGPLLKIKSLSSLSSNKKTKNPYHIKEDETCPLIRGFRFFSTQMVIAH
jgi:hypothetical protein